MKAESGKRKAESGKRKAESGKRKAESGKRKNKIHIPYYGLSGWAGSACDQKRYWL
jgi:hypothetical protein